MLLQTASSFSSAPDSPVRTAAALQLESPSASGAKAESKKDIKDDLTELPEVDLLPFQKSYDTLSLPTWDGSQLQDALHVDEYTPSSKSEDKPSSKSEDKPSSKSEDKPSEDKPSSKVDLRSILPKARRLEALLLALQKLYQPQAPTNPPSNSSTSSGAVAYYATNALIAETCSTGPDGPPAVISFKHTRTPDTSGEPSTSAPDAGSDATLPSRYTFPPPWLSYLAPSLLILTFTGSKHVNPASWQLSDLSRLSRITMLSMRETVITSKLPADLAERLPSLRVVFLRDAHFKLPEADVASMLIALSGWDPASAAGPGDDAVKGELTRRPLVLCTMAIDDDVWPPVPKGPRYRSRYYDTEKDEPLNIYYDVVSTDHNADADDEGTAAASVKVETKRLKVAAPLRAIRAARERVVLSYARGLWWNLDIPEISTLLPVPVDLSMVRLLYDLELLPPLPPDDEIGAERAAGNNDSDGNNGAKKPAGNDGESGKPAGSNAGDAAPVDKDEGNVFLFDTRTSARSKSVAYLSGIRLELAWPYKSPRLDAPTWTYELVKGNPLWDKFRVGLSTRQWSILMEAEKPAPDPLAAVGAPIAVPQGPGLLPLRTSHGGAAASGGPDLWNPFETEVLAFGTLETKMRVDSGVVFAAITGSPRRLIDPNGSGTARKNSDLEHATFVDRRPPEAAPVVIPTATALAARTAARRTLVAGLLGVGKAGMSPVVRGSVSMPMLMTAIRLESRLYGRIRRVSILPSRHPTYHATHADRYWTSVRSLYELLMADQRVRQGLLTGAVPLAAAVEIPAAELRMLLDKQAKAAQKSGGGDGNGRVDVGGPAMLLERATVACDVADMEALMKQTLAGGILNQPVPVIVEDWIPSERSLDRLCAWHIADPRVWPHGTVLHGAVARGQTRTVGWLLDQGLSLGARISQWQLTPLHLCCMRPCLWRSESEFYRLRRIPRAWAPTRPPPPPPRNPRNEKEERSDSFAARLDEKLGLPLTGVYLEPSDVLFPNVNRMLVGDVRSAQILGPLWYSVDDELKASQGPQHNTLQVLFVRNLPSTAPSAPISSAGSVPQSQLSASASPMLRLLLRHGADCGARSWCGLTPVQYAAATCGPETLAALAEAKADLRAPCPGTLATPLHMAAFRAQLRWSGMPPGAAARLLSYRAVASPTDLLALFDELRGCPLSRLVEAGKSLPTSALSGLLSNLKSDLNGRPATAEMMEGIARTMAICITEQHVDHVRLLLQYFPEAAAASLPPLAFTPLHVAAMLPAWWDAGKDTLIRTTVTGEPISDLNNLPKSIQDQCTPYATPEGVRQYAAIAATASVVINTDSAKKSAAAGSGGAGSAASSANKLELLVLGDTTSSSGVPASVTESVAKRSSEERWKAWPYAMITKGPPANEAIGETESAVKQACMSSQLQFIQMLLASGAPVDQPDVAGATALMMAAMMGSAPAVAALLAKGASLTTVTSPLYLMDESYALRRIRQIKDSPHVRCLGLDYLLVPEEAKSAPPKEKSSGDTGKGSDSEDSDNGLDVAGYDEEEDGGDDKEEDDEEDEDNPTKVFKSKPAPKAEPELVTTLGDELLNRYKKMEDWKEMFTNFRLTPLTAATLRVMQFISCSRRVPKSNLGRRADGEMADWKIQDSDSKFGRAAKYGDGIMWLIMRHGSATLRDQVLNVLRTTNLTELINELPRTSVWVVGEAMKGSRYVSYADRAAREACAALSPFTTVSLDAAIQKALNIAIQTARLEIVPNGASQSMASITGSGGRPRWGPHEDEILCDLMLCGLYPLFMSPNMTNGEASILRMSATLLHFATKAKVTRQALVEAHAAQFPPTAMQPAYATPAAPETELDAAEHSMEDTEVLLFGSFETACRRSLQRVTPALPPAAGGAPQSSGPSVVGSGAGAGAMSSVLLMHTQDDLEHGMLYSRVAELMAPVTSMRMAVGHRALVPDLSLRPLADTMFKFVRVLCHVSQKELEWVRMPGGVCQTAIDGLFSPLLPGDPGWNVTDIFRPRNLGFRLTFAYTRRSMTIELHAMSLMRTVPIDIQDATANGAGIAAVAAADASTTPATAASAPGGKVTVSNGAAAAAVLRGGGVGVEAVKNTRVDEFKHWLRNPDTVRMENVQSIAGRVESAAQKVHGNWRQMPVPPVWWISGWVDRFLRLFLLAALSGDENMKKTSLHTLYDTTVQDPYVPIVGPEVAEGGASASESPLSHAPWSPLEINVMSLLLQLQPLKMDEDDDEALKDMAGRPLNKKDVKRIKKILECEIASNMTSMVENNSPDRGCISFTAQWNKLAEQQKWPARSTLEVQEILFRLIRMSSCSYSVTWTNALTNMMAVLMAGDVSPELRRETEAKMLSLAADTAFARRLVWGTCRGRLAEARALALLSGVLEFQPALLAALLEHEQEGETLPLWHQSEHFWAIASGPALATMQPSYLATTLQLQHRLPQPPLVIPANNLGFSSASAATNINGSGPTTTGAATDSASAAAAPMFMYCRFSTRKQLERAVAKPLVVDDQWVALLPVSQWEATAVTSGAMPQRGAIQVQAISERERGGSVGERRAVALSFFSLVFSRLPRGLVRSDPRAGGTLWGRGLPAVVLHRRPAGSRWAPWSTPSDVAEEAAVVGALFDAHAAEPLPRTWMRELGASELGLVGYRDFLLTYMRHRAGDFLEGKQQSQLSIPSVPSAPSKTEDEGAVVDTATAADNDAVGTEGPQKPPALAASAGADGGGSAINGGARRWQAAVKQVAENQLAQAFWDRTAAMRRLRDRDNEVAFLARQNALWKAERDPKAGGGAKSVMKNFGARAMEALGGAMGAGQTNQLPSVTLAGLDAMATEEVCAVQRCAWVVYANLRSASRYLNLVQSEGGVTLPTPHSHFVTLNASPFATATPSGPASPQKNLGLTAWQAAERTALSAIMRPVPHPEALFTAVNVTEPQDAAYGGVGRGSGAGGGPRSWLQALAGAPMAGASNSGGAEDEREGGETLLAGASGPPGACRRDVPLLELLLELSAATGAAAHTDMLTEGEDRLVGPMAGPCRLLAGRTLAAAATQLGADAAFELASGCGALALSAASNAAAREGLAPPVGGLDEVFCASALKLAAEEVWGFVADMQALVDLVISPLVAAADQSVPIIQRESIKTIFGDTSIELIIEYEIELLKLMTVQWRGGARTAMVVPGVGGPAAYLTAAAQRRVAASRLRGHQGDYAPCAEELGVDLMSSNVQLRPLLTDPRATADVLELLQRLATAYQHYMDHIDEGLAELLTCLEGDEKGTLSALLRRFSRPVAVKYGKPVKGGLAWGLHPATAAAEAEVPGAGGDKSAEAGGAGGNGGDGNGDADKQDDGSSDSSEDEKEAEGEDKDGGKKDGAKGGKDGKNGDKGGKDEKRKGKEGGGRGVGVQLEPPPHHVRPLLSVRQMARYGPGAEVEACLRKPAAHLATLAFLATLCRSIAAAQEKLPDLTSTSALNATTSGALSLAPTTSAAPGGAPAGSTWGSDGTVSAVHRVRSGRVSEGPHGASVNGGSTAGRPSGMGGFLRRLVQRLNGVRVSRVLPLGNGVHPLLQVFPEALTGGATPYGGFVTAATMEHRVVLRSVGAAVLSNTGGAGNGGRLGGGVRTLADRLNVWMEERLLSGGRTSQILSALLTGAVYFTWRVVPLMAERRRAAEDMRVANNLLKHRRVIRQLERAINVRPDDDEALDAELEDLHLAIAQAVEEASKEMDLGEGDASKMSPMYLDAAFWDTKAPRRVSDPGPLRAALRAAESATLHSTFAGARLLSNARRCAARMGASPAAGGKGASSGKGTGNDGKGRKGGKGGSGNAQPAYDSDSDEAEKVLDAISTGPQGKKADKSGKTAPAGKEEKRKKSGGGAKGDESSAVVVPLPVARLFGNRKPSGAGPAVGLAVAAVAGGAGPKSAWGTSSGGGMATAAAAMLRARQFAAALRRAVKRREHARRRWDKTFYLVMQSGALDESLLSREHATAVAALNREATLRAWRQLRGAGSDILMVFGAVAFRDVGRTFALIMAFFLMAFPFVVLGVAVQLSFKMGRLAANFQPKVILPASRHDLLLMGGLVGAYVLAGFAAMAAAVAQLRRDPSQLKVYRPSDHIRFPNFRKGTALSSWKAHWVNVFALVTLVLEFWQLCAFSYQRRIPYPKTSLLKTIFPWALLDLGPAAYFLQVFALLGFMVVWIAVFFPQTPAGLKRVIMPFLGQAAYLTITAGLLSQLNCELVDGKLVRNTDITCWTDPRHLYGAVAAMLALGLYVPRATLTPFEVFFPSENLDVKYRGLYVRVVQLVRLLMAGYNLFFADTYPLQVMGANAVGCGLLASMTIIMRPCCIGAVNIVRGTGFVMATYSQIVSATALQLDPNKFEDLSKKGQWYTDSWKYVYVLFVGWGLIAAVGALLLRRHLRQLGSAAIRFSLKTSPFNFTRPRVPPEVRLAAAAAAAGSSSAARIERVPLPLPPPPTLPPAKTGDVLSASGSDGAQSPPPAKLGTDITLTTAVGQTDPGGEISAGEKKGEGGDKDDDSKPEEKKGGEDADDEKDDKEDSDDDEEEEEEEKEGRETGSGGSDGGGSGSGGTKTALSAARAAAEAAVSGSALGLPVMSRKLERKLWAQGLLTPLDEMLSYMSKLVRAAEGRLAGMDSEGSYDGRGRSDDDDDEDDDDEGEEGKEQKKEKKNDEVEEAEDDENDGD